MFIGAVGSWYWQGKYYLSFKYMKLFFLLNLIYNALQRIIDGNTFSILLFLGQVFSQNLLPKLRNDPHKTAEGSPSDDDSYLGYSVTTGEFDGDSSSPDVAVGMPRGAGLVGKVIYDKI